MVDTEGSPPVTRSNTQSNIMNISEGENSAKTDTNNTNTINTDIQPIIVEATNVNTILYIAQYLHVNENDKKNFCKILVEYDFNKDEFQTAEAKFRTDLIARSVTGVYAKTVNKKKEVQ